MGAVLLVTGVVGLEGVDNPVAEVELPGQGLGGAQLGPRDAGGVGGHGQGPVPEGRMGLHGEERAVHTAGIGNDNGPHLLEYFTEVARFVRGVWLDSHHLECFGPRAAFTASERLDTLVTVMLAGLTKSLGVVTGIIPVSNPR